MYVCLLLEIIAEADIVSQLYSNNIRSILLTFPPTLLTGTLMHQRLVKMVQNQRLRICFRSKITNVIAAQYFLEVHEDKLDKILKLSTGL